MYVSAEMLTTIVSLATLLVAFASGFGWMITRMDRIEQRLTTRIDAAEEKLTGRIDAVEHGLTEVKIEIARLEGPRPRLIPGR